MDLSTFRDIFLRFSILNLQPSLLIALLRFLVLATGFHSCKCTGDLVWLFSIFIFLASTSRLQRLLKCRSREQVEGHDDRAMQSSDSCAD